MNYERISFHSDMSLLWIEYIAEAKACKGKYSKIYEHLTWNGCQGENSTGNWPGQDHTRNPWKQHGQNIDLTKMGEYCQAYLTKIMILTPSPVILHTKPFECIIVQPSVLDLELLEKKFPFLDKLVFIWNPFPLMNLFFAKSEFVAFLTALSIKHFVQTEWCL